jgi:3-deoxy-D-manno-octulosonate 8-phosphate phosphatase (KDO 8-P phosphatase)
MTASTSSRAPGPAHALAEPKARAIRLVIFDVDGVLTDAGVYLGALPGGGTVELKRFDIQDGLGIVLLKRAGIRVAFVSGRPSEATTLRAAELGVEECHQDPEARKVPLVEGILRRAGATWEQAAMLADDLPDLAVFRRVGLKAAVANAQPEVAALAEWRSQSPGGRGAVREFCRALLAARGEWDRLIEAYERERS